MAITPKGIKYPIYADAVKSSSSPSALADDFRELAESADAAIASAVAEAVDEVDDKYGNLPDRVTAVEQKNAEQDNRLDGLEDIQAIKSVRFEDGQWVWGLDGATHYVLIGHDGKPTVRATPWPMPNPSTPSFNW